MLASAFFVRVLLLKLGLWDRGHHDETDSALDAEGTEVVHRSVKVKASCYEGGTANKM